MINWMKEAEKYKDEMIRDLEGLISIPSLRNDEEACEGAPFGKGPREALDYMLKLGEDNGFKTQDVDGYAGVIHIWRRRGKHRCARTFGYCAYW